jgi:hypothetical protein
MLPATRLAEMYEPIGGLTDIFAACLAHLATAQVASSSTTLFSLSRD